MTELQQTVPEALLLDGCLEGGAAAWRLLHRRYYPVAAAFLRKLGVRDADIEDLAQEVFLQLFRSLPRFRRESELSTWLYRLCATHARRSQRRARIGGMLSRLLSLTPTAPLVSTPSLPEDVARSRIERALDSLSPLERSVFVLYEMEGLPGKQIASIVNAPEASVWRRLHYARQNFRRALADEPFNESATR